MTKQAKPPVQARGEKRVTRILDAAAEEIARVGVNAMSMNAVAKLAGTAPGSLYQFFPAKSAIVTALSDRYLTEIRSIGEELAQSVESEPPAEISGIVERFVPAFAAFYAAHPAYPELFHALNRPGAASEAETALDGTIAGILCRTLRPFTAEAERPRLEIMARLMIEASHPVLTMLAFAEKDEAEGLLRELCILLVSYAGTLTATKQ